MWLVSSVVPLSVPKVAMSASSLFGIRVAHVRVNGFRMLAEVEVALEAGTTVILGENNAGKSALLGALDVVFGRSRPTVEDLHRSSALIANCIQIDVRFEPTAGATFDDEVVNALGDAIELGEGDAADSFSIRLEATREGAAADLKTRYAFLRGWGALAEEKERPAVSNDVRRRLSFELLDAQRDVVAQLRNRRTTWNDVAMLADVSDGDRDLLEAELRALGEKVTQKSALLTRVRSDLSDLGNALGSGPVNVDVATLPRRLDDLVRSMDITVATGDGGPFGVAVQGMGTRSLAALLVFRSAVNSARMPDGVGPAGAARLSAFEEPEAHLHPHAQRSVFSLIDAVGGQKIVTTHSTQIVSTAPTRAFRSFRRVGASAQASSTAGYPDDDIPDVERLFLHRHPEALFAKAVGLVEGDSDRLLVGRLASVWWPGGMESAGISILHCDGVGKVVYFAPLLSLICIPWTFLRDGDAEGEKAEAALKKKVRSVLRLPPDKDPVLDVISLEGVVEDVLLTLGDGVVDKILERHESGPLADYIDAAHGTARSKTPEENAKLPKEAKVLRDYKGVGGVERARRELVTKDKAQTARLFGEHIASTPPATWPSKLREFFRRLDQQAGRAPRTV